MGACVGVLVGANVGEAVGVGVATGAGVGVAVATIRDATGVTVGDGDAAVGCDSLSHAESNKAPNKKAKPNPTTVRTLLRPFVAL